MKCMNLLAPWLLSSLLCSVICYNHEAGSEYDRSKLLVTENLMQASWLPVSYEMVNSSTVMTLVSTLKSRGVTRIYVDVWNQGRVFFESQTMDSLVPSGAGTPQDNLKWTLDAARQIGGMEVYAWFEYGLIAAYGEINNDFAHEAKSRG